MKNLKQELCSLKDINKKLINDFKAILSQKENHINMLKFNLDKTMKNVFYFF